MAAPANPNVGVSMAYRYLLYIDILGFSNLVDEPARVADLYEVVASLNVHKHPDFKAIVFSDTILVYNINETAGRADPNYYVMYLCEFAQDLQARLLGKDIFFRAVLVRGTFDHYELNRIPCFYGKALVRAYQDEKRIKAIGLFIHSSLVQYSDVFHTENFNDEYDIVFITQGLERIRDAYDGQVPLPRELIEETEEIHSLSLDLLYMKQLFENTQKNHSAGVKRKFDQIWEIFKNRYPKVLGALAKSHFDWNSVSKGANWNAYMQKYPASYSWSIESRFDY